MSDMSDDDLGADIAAAMASPDASASVETVSQALDPGPATPASPDSRVRDEAGRFKAKDETAAPEAPKTPEVPKVDGQAVAEQPKTDATKTQRIAPPANWMGKGKVEWDRLPPPVQKELADDYTRTAQMEAQLNGLHSAIGQQRSQALAATYGSVENGIKTLLSMSDMASQDAPGFVRWFCQQRGIDPAQVFGQGHAQGDEPPQQPNPLEQEVAQLKTMLHNLTQQQTQGQQSQALSVVDAFAADPAHPYFNDVSDHVMALLKTAATTGTPQDRLQKAYDMACWAHPEIRQTLVAASQQKAADEEASRVAQARNASVSISGSPAGAKTPGVELPDDLESVVTAAVRGARG